MSQSWQTSEWKGSKPQRFSGGIRYMPPQNQLTSFVSQQYSSFQNKGLKTYQQKFSPSKDFKPSVRIYQDSYLPLTTDIDLKGKKCSGIGFQDHKQRIRKQKLHLPGGQQTWREIDPKGIVTFEGHNKSRNLVYSIEKQFQTKKKIRGLQCQRNNLNISSLGDKSYKYPDYSPNFFKDGGLIVGQTHRPRPNSQIPYKMGNSLSKPSWNTKVRMQEAAEERRTVNSVDEWQQTTLRQNNPNWKDPDAFFERQQGKKEQKKGKK